MKENISEKILSRIRDLPKIREEDNSNYDVFLLIKEVKSIIRLFFCSVIAGEYIGNSKIEENISKCATLIAEPIENLNTISDKNKSLLELKDIVESVKDIIDIYTLFIREVSIIHQNDYEDYFIVRNPSFSRKNRLETNLFISFLNVSYFDIQLSDTKRYYSDLEKIKRNIEGMFEGGRLSFLANEVKKIILKINFLLFKWEKRAKKDEKKIAKYIDGNRDRTTSRERITKNKEFTELINYIDNHYDDNKDPFIIKQCEDLLDDKNFDLYNTTAKNYHALIKYYKDITDDIDSLENIVSVIDYRRQKSNNDIIWETIYSYAKNNRFSLYVESCKDKYKLIEQYNDVKSDDKNYFSQFKTLNKALLLLEEETNDPSKVKDVQMFIKDYLSSIYDAYKNNMEWSLEHSHKMLYRLPYEECMVDDIYVHSGFMLPPPNKEAHDNYENIRRRYETLQMTIESLSKITPISNNVKELNDKIQKSEVKYVELIGLFTAVVAFIMGGVQGFTFVKSIWHALAFLFVLAFSLISFLLVLLLITRHDESILRKNWISIAIVYILLLILGYYSMCKIKSEKDNEKKIDEDKTKTTEIINSHIPPIETLEKVIKEEDSMRTK
ncbi:hypothetical protein EDL99_00635 [Ornithobacterium rhinotracheale]|uniref:hypothetical protein n=1 Tax=Ornithobacterium rhinotracheale TaxID=28251 RepID=UPI00129CCFB6|nr:hypothetical protein [Ornithobacterium rhinotracheale]MRJ07392.1 hypothetical protein [Ornithobacterium rhinotracheale]UOH77988.1 hypothetical protein MT996_00630 [Ornithobacterium rhinotracheale]